MSLNVDFYSKKSLRKVKEHQHEMETIKVEIMKTHNEIDQSIITNPTISIEKYIRPKRNRDCQ